jgi:hypothetical protein
MTEAPDRLRAAGWERAPSFRMVTLPSEVGDDELIVWRSPSGETMSQTEALAQLERPTKKGRKEH